MLSVGKGILVQIPDRDPPDGFVLHPAKIVAAGNDLYTAEFEEADVPLQSGLEVTLLYEWRGEFCQQPARIDVVMDDPHEGDCPARAPLVGFQTLDVPMRAERRQSYRVRTTATGVAARVGQEDCPVLDVSPGGFAVIGSGQWTIGDRLPVLLRCGSGVHTGCAMVQSARPLRDGRMRYGLLCLIEEGSTLRAGLERLSVSLQRQQLQRLMGA